jgi:aminoglycoside phosphotransferase (APT) family kinase protein
MTRPHDASTGTPLAEVDVDADLVRALIAAQHPDLAGLPVRLAATGWDNLTFRLGADLAVRLPRRLAGALLILKEQHWLPKLAGRLPLPVPATLRAGGPGEGYPWSWSIVPWLEGEPSDLAEPDETSADVLAGFLRALHQPATPDAPPNPYRGVPLTERKDHVEERMARLEASTSLVTASMRRLWARALAAPIDGGPVWLHGDLHAKNVLTAGGQISAVIDWGDMCAGDPATDLAAIWMLLPTADARRRAMAAYGSMTDATLLRARGWAVAFATMLSDAGRADDPRLAAMGERTFSHLAEDA